jgi:hypothetical protein
MSGRRHAACRPWPLSRNREAGREAVPSELKYVARTSRPAGDFRSRLFRCSPPISRLHRCNYSLRRLCPRYRRGLCAFIRRAGVIVPPGEPLGGTSPAPRLRLPRGGGAGPSPRNHRHDRCSRREELTAIMDQRRKAWRDGAEENANDEWDERVAGMDHAILSTFAPASPPARPSSRKPARATAEGQLSGTHSVTSPSHKREKRMWALS